MPCPRARQLLSSFLTVVALTVPSAMLVSFAPCLPLSLCLGPTRRPPLCVRPLPPFPGLPIPPARLLAFTCRRTATTFSPFVSFRQLALRLSSPAMLRTAISMLGPRRPRLQRFASITSIYTPSPSRHLPSVRQLRCRLPVSLQCSLPYDPPPLFSVRVALSHTLRCSITCVSVTLALGLSASWPRLAFWLTSLLLSRHPRLALAPPVLLVWRASSARLLIRLLPPCLPPHCFLCTWMSGVLMLPLHVMAIGLCSSLLTTTLATPPRTSSVLRLTPPPSLMRGFGRPVSSMGALSMSSTQMAVASLSTREFRPRVQSLASSMMSPSLTPPSRMVLLSVGLVSSPRPLDAFLLMLVRPSLFGATLCCMPRACPIFFPTRCVLTPRRMLSGMALVPLPSASVSGAPSHMFSTQSVAPRLAVASSLLAPSCVFSLVLIPTALGGSSSIRPLENSSAVRMWSLTKRRRSTPATLSPLLRSLPGRSFQCLTRLRLRLLRRRRRVQWPPSPCVHTLQPRW